MKLEIRALRAHERSSAAALVAEAMYRNPLEIAVGGNDPTRRRRVLARQLAALLAVAPAPALAACRGGSIVGVAGASPPGTCALPASALLRLLPALATSGPRALARRLRWLAEWGQHDPAEPHWHFGPVAVDPSLQCRGVGSRLLERLCARTDAGGQVAYLEADRPESVRFYRRFGFETVGETEVLGVRNWFMRRGGR